VLILSNADSSAALMIDVAKEFIAAKIKARPKEA
jgi:hypothetical protein